MAHFEWSSYLPQEDRVDLNNKISALQNQNQDLRLKLQELEDANESIEESFANKRQRVTVPMITV